MLTSNKAVSMVTFSVYLIFDAGSIEWIVTVISRGGVSVNQAWSRERCSRFLRDQTGDFRERKIGRKREWVTWHKTCIELRSSDENYDKKIQDQKNKGSWCIIRVIGRCTNGISATKFHLKEPHSFQCKLKVKYQLKHHQQHNLRYFVKKN